jgi:hypothetical protein
MVAGGRLELPYKGYEPFEEPLLHNPHYTRGEDPDLNPLQDQYNYSHNCYLGTPRPEPLDAAGAYDPSFRLNTVGLFVEMRGVEPLSNIVPNNFNERSTKLGYRFDIS